MIHAGAHGTLAGLGLLAVEGLLGAALYVAALSLIWRRRRRGGRDRQTAGDDPPPGSQPCLTRRTR